LKEILDKTGLNVKLIPRKTGKKVTRVVFVVGGSWGIVRGK